MRSSHARMASTGTLKSSRDSVASAKMSRKSIHPSKKSIAEINHEPGAPRLILPLTFTEDRRGSMGIILGVVNWILVLASMGLLSIGLYLKGSLDEYTNLITGYDGSILIYLIIALGVICVVANVVGGFVFFQTSHPGKREVYYMHIKIYMYISLMLAVLALVVAIMCFVSISHLERSFKGGISTAMKEYNEDVIVKAELHDLQSNFECCGNTGYTDWFSVSWIISEYSRNFHRNISGYFHDDVPFSCCNKFSDRPCINMDIHTNRKHHNYDYQKDLTIYTSGCTKKIMEFYGDFLLINGGSFVMVIFGLQVLILILVRFYQTSIFEATEKGDPEAETVAYLFKRAPAPYELTKVESEPYYDEIASVGSRSRQSSRHSQSYRHPSRHSHRGSQYHAINDGRDQHAGGNETWHNNQHSTQIILPTTPQY